jgi:hypothetical protein
LGGKRLSAPDDGFVCGSLEDHRYVFERGGRGDFDLEGTAAVVFVEVKAFVFVVE